MKKAGIYAPPLGLEGLIVLYSRTWNILYLSITSLAAVFHECNVTKRSLVTGRGLFSWVYAIIKTSTTLKLDQKNVKPPSKKNVQKIVQPPKTRSQKFHLP